MIDLFSFFYHQIKSKRVLYLITNTSKMPNRSWKSFNHHSINGSQMNETYDTGTVEGRERVRLCWVQLLSGIINSKPVVWPVFLSTFPHVRGLRQTKGSTLWIFCSRVPDRWFELIWILCFKYKLKIDVTLLKKSVDCLCG